MDLKEISQLQTKIEDFNESLMDAKELLIEKKPVTSKIHSDLSYKSHVLISSLFKLSMQNKNTITNITENEILDLICEAAEVTQEEIKKNAHRRKRETMIPRQIFETLLYVTFKKSLSSAARTYGKDHATILNSMKIVNNLIDTDSDFRQRYGYVFLLCNEINPKTKNKINIDKLSQQL